MNDETENADQE